MTFPVLALILVTVTLSACAQLALKLGVSRINSESVIQHGIAAPLFAAVTSPLILLGLFIYLISVALWLWVLSRVDLSVAYPFVGVGFLVTMGFGAFVLNEAVTPMRIIGTILVGLGCFFVGRTG